jgi:two-component system nitrate/nitrite response regulator NarL
LLVVDAHPVVHEGLRLFLAGDGSIGTMHSALTGAEGIATARRANPDVALVDPWLPDMLLDEAVRRMRVVSPCTRLIVYASSVSPGLREEAERLAVDGILGKDAEAGQLSEIVAEVAAGRAAIDPLESDFLDLAAAKLGCPALTPREHEILRLAARGESNAEIAGKVFLAPTTVKSYLQSALRKLGARNRVEAVFKLSELRLL